MYIFLSYLLILFAYIYILLFTIYKQFFNIKNFLLLKIDILYYKSRYIHIHIHINSTRMMFISSVLYYYFIKTTNVKKLDIEDTLQSKNNYKDKIIDLKTKKYNTKKQITKIIPSKQIDILDIDILNNNNLYYEYNGYRFLSNFPKKWLETIDTYENIGLNCSNCKYYCCIETKTHLPLFLGFCSNCYINFLLNKQDLEQDLENPAHKSSVNVLANPADECNNCNDCNDCINNVIDYSNEIIDVIITNKGNKKMLKTLIIKLNDEYNNLDAL